jgi:hypothetical protein
MADKSAARQVIVGSKDRWMLTVESSEEKRERATP